MLEPELASANSRGMIIDLAIFSIVVQPPGNPFGTNPGVADQHYGRIHGGNGGNFLEPFFSVEATILVKESYSMGIFYSWFACSWWWCNSGLFRRLIPILSYLAFAYLLAKLSHHVHECR